MSLNPITLLRGNPANELVESFSGFTDFSPGITVPVLEVIRSGGVLYQPPWGPTSLVQIVGNIIPDHVAIHDLPLQDDVQQLEFPNLGLISGDFAQSLDALTNLQFDALLGVGGDFAPIIDAAVGLGLGQLSFVGGDFAPHIASLHVLALPILANVYGKIAPVSTALTSVNLNSLITVGGDVDLSGNAGLVAFTIGGGPLLEVGGDFTITGAALPQADVDNILVLLAALNGTGGTTSYDGHAVDLSGGTSAAPSATGLAAKVTLVGRGNTVTTN